MRGEERSRNNGERGGEKGQLSNHITLIIFSFEVSLKMYLFRERKRGRECVCENMCKMCMQYQR